MNELHDVNRELAYLMLLGGGVSRSRVRGVTVSCLSLCSGGKECAGDLQYLPFRMTPYLMKVQDSEHTEDQFCCLLLAERVHSGYDGTRTPPPPHALLVCVCVSVHFLRGTLDKGQRLKRDNTVTINLRNLTICQVKKCRGTY